MFDELKEIIQDLFEIVRQAFCNHEWESSEIYDDSFNELSSWCKKCGKARN